MTVATLSVLRDLIGEPNVLHDSLVHSRFFWRVTPLVGLSRVCLPKRPPALLSIDCAVLEVPDNLPSLIHIEYG